MNKTLFFMGILLATTSLHASLRVVLQNTTPGKSCISACRAYLARRMREDQLAVQGKDCFNCAFGKNTGLHVRLYGLNIHSLSVRKAIVRSRNRRIGLPRR
jgi:hypothetical protein